MTKYMLTENGNEKNQIESDENIKYLNKDDLIYIKGKIKKIMSKLYKTDEKIFYVIYE